ncbi:hypothetical protein AA106555_0457 [Neokomagataea thailandica NBRC 106555]|uniref:Uncharacterized protein n=1 Tax=Neokomagataea thailandica NBRC 106555 TaxID=1223520 RepID=A0ABQ0QN59_9PROT|nr:MULTISPECIES: hypothetical protein [Neokomagataea]GBR51165.1 hypothetical protein AA106555_0457 [Neokomagataea thailandica NBRC 106555]
MSIEDKYKYLNKKEENNLPSRNDGQNFVCDEEVITSEQLPHTNCPCCALPWANY